MKTKTFEEFVKTDKEIDAKFNEISKLLYSEIVEEFKSLNVLQDRLSEETYYVSEEDAFDTAFYGDEDYEDDVIRSFVYENDTLYYTTEYDEGKQLNRIDTLSITLLNNFHRIFLDLISQEYTKKSL
jgi:hypothetical protein